MHLLTINNFTCSSVNDTKNILKCQELRSKYFNITTGDKDEFDETSYHLIVTDNENIIATCRAILPGRPSYVNTLFDTSGISSIRNNLIEVGRFCVSEHYRKTIVTDLLWNGIREFALLNNCTYFIGCMSIDLSEGFNKASYVKSITDNKCHESLKVIPKRTINLPTDFTEDKLPPSIKRILSYDAYSVGELYHDITMNCVDIPMILDINRIPIISQ